MSLRLTTFRLERKLIRPPLSDPPANIFELPASTPEAAKLEKIAEEGEQTQQMSFTHDNLDDSVSQVSVASGLSKGSIRLFSR